ncbi:MAG: His/Gly/Thr/Pro-type tRNA ligase C-terminal domain-containing protein [Patescibacteria group bacterium]
MHEKSIWLSREFDKPLVTASYFGFRPIETPRVSKEDIVLREEYGSHPYFDVAENAAFIRVYLERGLQSEMLPLSVVYKRSSPNRGIDKYSLHFVGSSQGIADAMLIRGALSMLEDFGCKHLVVEINSVGDKESMSSYERELHSHLRKSMSDFSETVREQIKKDVFNLFNFDLPETESIRHSAPSPISSLSTQSRSYFKEVLEYLETLGIEFHLAHELIGNRKFCSQTIFRIREENGSSENVVAVGHHYSKLGKRLGLKREIPMASATVFGTHNAQQDTERMKMKIYKDLPKQKFCLVHLGKEAKMRSLPLLEQLRKERIRVHHSLGKDKIAVQLSSIEGTPVSHLIIVGQKEALDGTATVRNVATRAQTTISINELPLFLKHISL